MFFSGFFFGFSPDIPNPDLLSITGTMLLFSLCFRYDVYDLSWGIPIRWCYTMVWLGRLGSGYGHDCNI